SLSLVRKCLVATRPFSEEELRNNAPQVVTCNEYQREVAVSQNIAGKHIDRVFVFDKVFGPSAQQKDLYDQAVIPIVNEVLEGFNCTIFAYGQTGTGKTYTMEGECKRSKNGPNGDLPPEAGVIPRAVKQIFDTLESQNAEYSVKVTFLELYNEEITDLLAPEEISRVALEDRQKKQLPLMEDGKGGVLVRGLEEEIVTSASEIFTLLERGSAKRRTAETLLNKQSSRSHSLFSITIHIKEATPEGEELIKCGKLNLVDLAGSENISRSGAREGRAREAGEINKSLLTLGRVISALVEHLGHVPYRDSKLTRLLRDSLGGRTKTCIIATVSPAVHCLEETLSTLDYAHRAKHIRNKPEVNQKMMKSTLIKDLYGEIERLKAEVYAAREKNGVYMPKERYYQEESEKKAMADQIEQMVVTIETNQKQLEELQDKFDDQVQKGSDLSNKLDATQKNLNQTSKLLASTEEELRRCQYALKECDFIISEQKKAENALAHQASVLRTDLEKSLQDNASLYLKIAREDKLNADNRSVVNDFQTELAQQLGSLCNTVAISMSRQGEHLQCIEKHCHFFLAIHNKAVIDLKKKMTASRALYISHMEAMQNVVRLHNASSNAAVEEISASVSSNIHSIEQFLAAEAVEANSIFDDLQGTLSTHQGEMAHFARELRQRFHASVEHSKNISEFTYGFLHQLIEQSKNLQSHATQVDEIQTTSIKEFQKAYEEQSTSDAEKLIADVTNLVSSHIRRQKELVDERLIHLKDTVIGNKTFLDGHVSSMEGITTDAKRKWQEFSVQAENDAKDCADFSAAKHCRMELLFQQCVNTAETASKHWKRTHESINEIGSQNVSTLVSLVRDVSDSNEQHDTEIALARTTVEEDVANNSEDFIQHFDRVSEQECASVSDILATVKAHANTIEVLREDHSVQSASIEQKTMDTFQQKYMTANLAPGTPVRPTSILVVGSTGTLGRQIVRRALDEGYDVRCLVRPRPAPADFLRDWGATVVNADLSKPETIPATLVGIHTVIDCATGRPEEPIKTVDWEGNCVRFSHLGRSKMSGRPEKEKGVNVQVLLRCRPFSEEELRSNAPQVLTCNEYQREVAVSQNIAGKHIDRVFTFDKVFGPSAQQKDLYDQAVVPIVNEVLEGFNCTIFAYGQTGTGKTYTMEGECKRSKSGPNGDLPLEAGVIPRAVKQIFDTLESQNAEYSVKVTFLELYNEEITDLLAPEEISRVALEDRQKKQLPLMEDGKGGVLVRGLEEEIVTSASEIFTLLERGSAKRRTAETLLNKQSSRSHSLFSITIHIKEATPEGEELIKCGKLNLVDLAGSENISRSGAREGRAREAGEINKSLLTLGRVNQKMMKSTLIKDLYGEIERLKAEVYAAREKNGVYIPKERYYQEESEKKAMADQIEQMEVTIETHQKQLEELQDKFDDQVKKCSDIDNKLDATQKNLNQTSKSLASTEEELRRCQYALKECDFIISEQKKAENALAHQASVLRSDLEKSLQDNASLYLKIEREDKLNADNRSVVNGFRTDLAQQLGSLCNTVAKSMSRQSEHLQCIEKHCQSFLDIHNKAVIDLKKKMTASRAVYISHMEAVQNVVCLHNASSNAAVEEISASVSSNFLAAEAIKANSIFDDLQGTLSTHQGEMAHFARDLRQRFHASIEQSKNISEYTHGFLHQLIEQSKNLQSHATQVDEIQTTSIEEFEKAYAEQSTSDAEKLIADVTNLVSSHIRRQKELVDARLIHLKDTVIGNKTFLDGHVSSMEGITTDAKRKWQEFSVQAENDAKDCADFSAAKHCRMELLFQQCVNTAETASKHWKRTHESVNEIGSQNVSTLVSLVRNVSDSNVQHDTEIALARAAVEEEMAKNSEDIIQHFDSVSEQERGSISGILATVEAHANILEVLGVDHSVQSTSIEQKAVDTFQQKYMDYEPTGTTPIRCEPDIPCKGTIESLRAMPMEALLEEFRENHSYESFEVKESKPSLIPRSPLIQLN
ncbi:hypothetical protein HYC85_006903, partial [Camellia sinensis]